LSFSNEVKDELSHQWPGRRCCRSAELSAIIRMDGSLHLLGGERYALHMTTENAAVARKGLRLLSRLYGLSGEVTIRRSKLSRANNYLVYINSQPPLEQALNELGILDDRLNLRQDVPRRLVRNDCCAIAYIRGLFLAGGSISNPKSHYHLEMVTDNYVLARTIEELLVRFNIKAKVVERRGSYAVYLKKGQAIVDLLALIGAHTALLKWEDVGTLKNVRSSVNRLVNCDTANLNKAVKASLEQLSDIAKIDSLMGLASLPPALREVAEIRQNNPQMNIKELGLACNPQLTKSAVYHRIRRLRQVASRLGG
jgi:cell division protein WhiA